MADRTDSRISLTNFRRVLGPAMAFAVATLVVLLVFRLELTTARERGAFIFREGEQKSHHCWPRRRRRHTRQRSPSLDAAFWQLACSSGRLTVRYNFCDLNPSTRRWRSSAPRGYHPSRCSKPGERRFFGSCLVNRVPSDDLKWTHSSNGGTGRSHSPIPSKSLAGEEEGGRGSKFGSR